MKFQTTVDSDGCGLSIEHTDGIVTLGSCFAEDVAERLQRSMLSVCVNPFGTLYNPASIAAALCRLMAEQPYTTAELVSHENLWHSMDHHSRFSSVDRDTALTRINNAYDNGCRMLKSARHLIVTFGTAYVFEQDGKVVANCHKMPAAQFTRRCLSADEIAALWTPLIDKLLAYNPSLDITFTVSPVRHLADSAHGNQLSKATLLLAVDRIVAEHAGVCHYFPSYEIVLDELRDYRFFAADMVHPSDVAVDYVAERFQRSCLTAGAQQIAARCAKLHARLRHRPLTDDAAAAMRFSEATKKEAEALVREYPHLHQIIVNIYHNR